MELTCRKCGKHFSIPPRRGRPPTRCDSCKDEARLSVKDSITPYKSQPAVARAARLTEEIIQAPSESVSVKFLEPTPWKLAGSERILEIKVMKGGAVFRIGGIYLEEGKYRLIVSGLTEGKIYFESLDKAKQAAIEYANVEMATA